MKLSTSDALKWLPGSPLIALAASSLMFMGIAPMDGCQSGGDADGDGYTTDQGDCDDTDPSVNPGAVEVCGDGIDNNCDGQDEACSVTPEACYMGPDRDYAACYEVVAMTDPPPSGYAYDASCESAYGSNYRAPENLLDLYTIDSGDYIAPNFTMGEVAQSSKGQFAVVQSHAIDSLQWIRDALGPINITSGYRSPSYNASVGGASCSRHMYGDAFDMYASTASLDDVGAECYAQEADYVDLYEDGHVHCDWRYATLDTAFYGAGKTAFRLNDAPVRQVTLRLADGRWYADARGWDEGEPLKEWTAYDARGRVLEEATGAEFLPPAGTAQVECFVGGTVVARGE